MKKQETENAVTVKQENSVAKTTEMMGDAGISATDLLISRVGVMNALSELVKSGEFRIGDIVDTDAEEKLGDAKTSFDFVVLKTFKYWTTTKDKEYVKGSKRPAINNNELPWTEDGGIKNIYNQSFYILLRRDLETGVEIPYTINFRSTEIKKAKRICTILYRMLQQGTASYGNYFSMSTKEERSGKDSWMGAKISVGEKVPEALQEKARRMLDMINKAEAAGTIKASEDEHLSDETTDQF